MMTPTRCPSKVIMESKNPTKLERRLNKSRDDVIFPLKLYKMLSCASDESFEDIVSWEPNGRSFVIRDTDKFAKKILPRFFTISRMYIFNKRLRNHGFIQGSQGEAQAYHHRMFVRGKPNLVANISERVEKKVSSSPSPEPAKTKEAEQTAMAEEQSVVTVSSDSHQSKSNQSDDDYSLTEAEDPSSEEESAWEDEDEKEENKQKRSARLTREVEKHMNSEHFLQELMDDIAMNLDEYPPVVPSEGETAEPTKPEVKAMPPPVDDTPTELSNLKIPDPAPVAKPAAVPAPLNRPAPMNGMGPIRTPARLRNGFGMGIRAVCVHSVPKNCSSNRGTVINEIYVDTAERDRFETSEFQRYQKCLLRPISKELNHIVWPSPPKSEQKLEPVTSFPPATSCAITDHDELIAL